MSRAQSLYREYLKEINQLIRLIQSAIKQGEFYTITQVQDFIDQILLNFEDELTEQQLNVSFWHDKLTLHSENKITDIQDLLSEEEEENPFEEEVNELTEFFELTEEECREETPGLPGNGSGIPRNHILLSEEEVIEYSKGIPIELIKGFIPVYNKRGEKIGWKPCILSDTW